MSMEIFPIDIISSLLVILSVTLGILLSWRFFQKFVISMESDKVKQVLSFRPAGLLIWLILAYVFSLPLIDISFLLVGVAEIPHILSRPLSEQMISSGWGTGYYTAHVVMRTILFVISYVYAARVLTRLLPILFHQEKRPLKPRTIEGISVILVVGATIHQLADLVASGIQQLPISTWRGFETNFVGYILGWLASILLIAGILLLMDRILEGGA